MKSPAELIANWLWNEADLIDYDDMGEQAGQDIVQALNDAGYEIVHVRAAVVTAGELGT